MISIAGLAKPVVLKALFDYSRQQGMGFIHAKGMSPLSLEDAKAVCDRSLSFDYVGGRVLKVDISGDSFEEYLYDRDNGAGTAARAIASLR